MARSQVLLLACLLGMSAMAAARVMSEDSPARALKQFGAQAFCPDGCASDGCIQDSTKGGLRCQKCLQGMVVNQVTGNCACPAGRYVDMTNGDQCTDCPKGSYCPGSDYFKKDNPLNPLKDTFPGVAAPRAITCPGGVGAAPTTSGTPMTTLGKRSTSVRACVNTQGNYYVVNNADSVDQVTCPVDTYGPGLKKQRACVPCPTGYKTDGKTGQSVPTACVVPAGYYLKTVGQVAPCPKGEWKSGTGTAGNCTKCAFGVTTANEASTSVNECTILQKGYYAASMSGGVVTSTKACPQNFYCPGGIPTAAFTPATPNADSVSGTPATRVIACPQKTWTQSYAASTLEQCLTPPGHFTANGNTTQCPAGYYRADWLPPSDPAAAACLSCGEGVKTVTTDRLTQYHPVTYAESYMEITTSSDDCYILPGQGLYYTTLTKSWRAKDCIKNNYGVANRTYGLTPSPCKDCPTNMVAVPNDPTYPTSGKYYVMTAGGGGFTDEMACVTQDGYGYNGRNSQKCPLGTYNARDTYQDCKSCGYGLTTQAVGAGVTAADCGVAAGYYFNTATNQTLPCVIGTYNDVAWTAGLTKQCTNCTSIYPGLTTKAEGAATRDACNYCIPGFGGANCEAACGGDPTVTPTQTATYGPADRSIDTAGSSQCVECTKQATGYSFDWGLQNDVWASKAVSKPYATSPADCVAKYSQIVDQQFYIEVNTAADDTKINRMVVTTGVNSFSECVAKCGATCMFATYDYQNKKCTIRVHVEPTYVGSPLIGLKNLPSGDVGVNAASLPEEDPAKDVVAKLVSTGTYTFYRDEYAEVVGDPRSPQTPVAVAASDSDTDVRKSLQECLSRCDDQAQCIGITIRMNVNVTERATTCKTLYGNVKPGTFLRSVIRADTVRMPLPNLASNT